MIIISADKDNKKFYRFSPVPILLAAPREISSSIVEMHEDRRETPNRQAQKKHGKD
jgi:hypothetical protein